MHEFRIEQLRKFKSQLPPRIAKILDLYYANGLTQAQIAKTEGMSLSLVKKLFYIGHEQLRQQIIESEKKWNKYTQK